MELKDELTLDAQTRQMIREAAYRVVAADLYRKDFAATRGGRVEIDKDEAFAEVDRRAETIAANIFGVRIVAKREENS